MTLATIRLKKGEDRRIRHGHLWIFSNEIANEVTPLKNFQPGQEVLVEAYDGTGLGVAYLNPHSLICGRLFSRNSAERLDAALLEHRLNQALHLRTTLFNRPFYRLVFSEGDQLPGVIIDRFNEHLVMQINTAGMDVKHETLKEALLKLLPDTASILLRNDSRIREQEGLKTYTKALYGQPPEEIAVEENQLIYYAPLWAGQKTGWFYDHRLNRTRLQTYVPNKKVLDVFSYLGAFGLQAARFLAEKVDCIDASPFACDYIQKNIEANQFAGRVNVICDDAFDAMRNLLKNHQQYDVIILDPPAFIKKAKDKKEGLLAYTRLNEMALKLLAPNGILISCSCSMHMHLSDMIAMMQRLAFRLSCHLQLLERGHQGPDHPVHISIPETDYLKTIIVRKI